MVFYFSTKAHKQGEDAWLIYMGKDKHENEDLIKYGWPVDVWFHVDNLSSAHVYLRLPDDGDLDKIPEDVLAECCQLVKQNSIQGCKAATVDIVYTMWANLKKTASMEVGQVGFHKQKDVRKVKAVAKVSEPLKRISKTQVEDHPDLEAQRKEFDRRAAKEAKRKLQEQKQEEQQRKEEMRREADQRSYTHLMVEDDMQSNKVLAQQYATAEDYEDDFM
eukprot:jgi/Ulvmu1/7985/UM004_0220.1